MVAIRIELWGQRKATFVRHLPDVPLALARQRRDTARKLVAVGIDPSEQRRDAQAAQAPAVLNSFCKVVERWKVDELAANSQEYQQSISRMFDHDVLPYIGERPMAEVKTRDLITVFGQLR